MVHDTDIPMALRYARAFQIRRRFSDWQEPVFGRVADLPLPSALSLLSVPSLPPPAVAIGEAGAGAAGAGAVEAGEAAAGAAAGAGEAVGAVAAVTGITSEEAEATAKILAQWAEWSEWIRGDAKGKKPVFITDTLKIWTWILNRYRSIPEAQMVALRWWFDHKPFADQRRLLEEAIRNKSSSKDSLLEKTLKDDIFVGKSLASYRIYNPNTMSTEWHCRVGETTTFKLCSSKLAEGMEKSFASSRVKLNTDMGPLFGFMAAKKGETVFKTLDTTTPIKPSSVGAECGNTSNLSVHRPRVRILHAAGRDSDIAPLMLPDDDESWDAPAAERQKHLEAVVAAKGDAAMTKGALAAVAANRQAMKTRAGDPTHLNDLTHQPLCLYMEFLTRILDARKVAGKRWFLTATVAAAAGLRGRK
jgi:hypothetical protein